MNFQQTQSYIHVSVYVCISCKIWFLINIFMIKFITYYCCYFNSTKLFYRKYPYFQKSESFISWFYSRILKLQNTYLVAFKRVALHAGSNIIFWNLEVRTCITLFEIYFQGNEFKTKKKKSFYPKLIFFFVINESYWSVKI